MLNRSTSRLLCFSCRQQPAVTCNDLLWSAVIRGVPCCCRICDVKPPIYSLSEYWKAGKMSVTADFSPLKATLETDKSKIHIPLRNWLYQYHSRIHTKRQVLFLYFLMFLSLCSIFYWISNTRPIDTVWISATITTQQGHHPIRWETPDGRSAAAPVRCPKTFRGDQQDNSKKSFSRWSTGQQQNLLRK